MQTAKIMICDDDRTMQKILRQEIESMCRDAQVACCFPCLFKAEDDTASNKSVKPGQPEEDSKSNTFDAEQLGVPFSRGYQPVDVKL